MSGLAFTVIIMVIAILGGAGALMTYEGYQSDNQQWVISGFILGAIVFVITMFFLVSLFLHFTGA